MDVCMSAKCGYELPYYTVHHMQCMDFAEFQKTCLERAHDSIEHMKHKSPNPSCEVDSRKHRALAILFPYFEMHFTNM